MSIRVSMIALIVALSGTIRSQLVVGQSVLWDNGDADGSGASSNRSDPYRSLLDDFVVPAGQEWELTGFETLGIWLASPPGSGEDFELTIWSHTDDHPRFPGVPGPLERIAPLAVTSFSETETGRQWHSRPEVLIAVSHEPYQLAEGKYWIEMHMLSGEAEFFQMQRSEIRGESYWVDYHDFGGLQPSINISGVREDLSWKLLGNVVGGYSLSIDGACPGSVTVIWSAAGEGRQALVIGDREGNTTIPSGPCAGTVLGIEGRVRLVSPPGLFNTRGGSGSITGNANSAACGRFLQLIKAGTCNTSNVVQMPQ